MFVQVFQAKVSDPEGLRKQMDRWDDEIRPGAIGHLGSTAGVTEGGNFIAIGRFESAEAADQNAARPEQSQWFEETSSYFDGEPTFHNCTDVQTWLDGGSDDAGFVQIIQARVKDVDRLMVLIESSEADIRRDRTAIIGGLVAHHGDGGFTESIYFTSESEAREQERLHPAEGDEFVRELQSLVEGPHTFMDLKEPRLFGP